MRVDFFVISRTTCGYRGWLGYLCQSETGKWLLSETVGGIMLSEYQLNITA